MMTTLQVEDDCEADDLFWVRAGEPGEKPTIIRQIRSESSSSSSRDNSGSSTYNRKNLLTVENGTVHRTGSRNSNDSLHTIRNLDRTSSNDSRVIVVNISEQIYPAHVNRQRIQKWKELHSPSAHKKDFIRNNNNIRPKTKEKRPLSQPTRPISNCSPKEHRCTSAEPLSSPNFRIKMIKTRDEGYTSLSEDCKDSDTESVRSKSLPSSWKPTYLNQRQEKSLHKYAKQMTSNDGENINFLSCDEVDSSENRLLHKESRTKSRKSSKLRHNIENAIEICTCFVCVRSAVYHAEDEDDTDSLVDHPCSCDSPSPKCCGRWAVISLMVCFLPFLLCYPPLKSCLCIHDARKKKKEEKKEKKLSKKIRNKRTVHESVT